MFYQDGPGTGSDYLEAHFAIDLQICESAYIDLQLSVGNFRKRSHHPSAFAVFNEYCCHKLGFGPGNCIDVSICGPGDGLAQRHSIHGDMNWRYHPFESY